MVPCLQGTRRTPTSCWFPRTKVQAILTNRSMTYSGSACPGSEWIAARCQEKTPCPLFVDVGVELAPRVCSRWHWHLDLLLVVCSNYWDGSWEEGELSHIGAYYMSYIHNWSVHGPLQGRCFYWETLRLVMWWVTWLGGEERGINSNTPPQVLLPF